MYDTSVLIFASQTLLFHPFSNNERPITATVYRNLFNIVRRHKVGFQALGLAPSLHKCSNKLLLEMQSSIPPHCSDAQVNGQLDHHKHCSCKQRVQSLPLEQRNDHQIIFSVVKSLLVEIPDDETERWQHNHRSHPINLLCFCEYRIILVFHRGYYKRDNINQNRHCQN